jgi:hypothetical protein
MNVNQEWCQIIPFPLMSTVMAYLFINKDYGNTYKRISVERGIFHNGQKEGNYVKRC